MSIQDGENLLHMDVNEIGIDDEQQEVQSIDLPEEEEYGQPHQDPKDNAEPPQNQQDNGRQNVQRRRQLGRGRGNDNHQRGNRNLARELRCFKCGIIGHKTRECCCINNTRITGSYSPTHLSFITTRCKTTTYQQSHLTRSTRT